MSKRGEFARLRKEMSGIEQLYEEAFKQSREVVKISKKVIYAVHRGDIARASDAMKEISVKVRRLRKKCVKPELHSQLRIAEQEYVEAACFYEFVKNGSIPEAEQLGVAAEHYLLGLCDLSGEMVRKGMNAAINREDETALKIKDFMESLYDELMQFDFRNSELRRKFDGIKYDLKKLEEMAFQITRK